MSLKGSLQTAGLVEVLHFLATTAKTGELHVAGVAGDGRLWFDDGRICGFDAGSSEEPYQAIFELLRISNGDFEFSADSTAPEGTRQGSPGEDDVERAVEAAEARLEEWNRIVEVVPSLDHQLRLCADISEQTVSLERAQWAMVVAIGSGSRVGDVIAERSLAEFDGCRALRDLVEAYLVEVREPGVAAATDETAVYGPADDEPAAEALFADDPAAGYPRDDVASDDDGHPGGLLLRFGAPDAGGELAAGAAEGDPSGLNLLAGEPVAGEEATAGDPAASGEGVATAALDADEASFTQFPVWTGSAEAGADGPWSDPSDIFGHRPGTDDDGSDNDGSDGAGHQAFDPSTLGGPGAVPPPDMDRYAALRAAMVEVGENLVVDDEPGEIGEGSVYELQADRGQDARAALEALLTEVTAPLGDATAEAGDGGMYPSGAEDARSYGGEAYGGQTYDALADRGPWSESELATFDSEGGWVGDVPSDADVPSNIVAFAPLHQLGDEDGSEPGREEAADAGMSGGSEPEEAPVPEPEPINRGLLLKFLSSVRN